jgi:hypothetical protein
VEAFWRRGTELNRKLKIALIVVAVALLGLSFVPMWTDPYHEKEEPVIFWEWLYKEIVELVSGEK